MLARLPSELWLAVSCSLGGDDIARAISISRAMGGSLDVDSLIRARDAPNLVSLEQVCVRDAVARILSRRQAVTQQTHCADMRIFFGQRGMIVRRDSRSHILPEVARLLRAHKRLVLRVSGHPDTPCLWFPGDEGRSRARALETARTQELKAYTKRRARTLAAALRSEGVARARARNAHCCTLAIRRWARSAEQTTAAFDGSHVKLHLGLDGATFPGGVDFDADVGDGVECWATVCGGHGGDEIGGESDEDSSSDGTSEGSDSDATDATDG